MESAKIKDKKDKKKKFQKQKQKRNKQIPATSINIIKTDLKKIPQYHILKL